MTYSAFITVYDIESYGKANYPAKNGFTETITTDVQIDAETYQELCEKVAERIIYADDVEFKLVALDRGKFGKEGMKAFIKDVNNIRREND